MTQTEYDTFEHGIGTGITDPLRSERGAVGEIKENSPIAIHGVALPENTVLQGGQGVRHFYPPEMAQRAADILQQQLDADEGRVHIVKNFHELEGQATADDIIGEVTAVGYSEGVGVTFQGEITDETTAEKIDLGYLDVSPTVARALGEEMDPQLEARPVSDVGGFRDIAVVGQGQPGASVDVGTNPAIEALHRTIAFGDGPPDDGEGADGEGADGDTDAPTETGADAESDTDADTDTMSLDDATQTLADEYDLDPDEVERRLTTDPDALENEDTDGSSDDGEAGNGGGDGADGSPDEPVDDGRVLLVEAGDTGEAAEADD